MVFSWFSSLLLVHYSCSPFTPPFFMFMAREFAKAFYKSEEWQRARQLALSRDNFLCQDCLNSGYITQAEEVHHIIELSPDNINDPSITTELHNLISLCHNCHSKRHLKYEKRYRVDKEGNLVF